MSGPGPVGGMIALAGSATLLILYTNQEAILAFIRDFLVASTRIMDLNTTKKLDDFVLRNCWSKSMSINHAEPGDGYHLYADGPILFHRQCSNGRDVTYRIYARKTSHIDWVNAQIQDYSNFSINKIASTTPFDHTVVEFSVHNIPPNIYPYQQKIVDNIFNNYKKSGTQIHLISGSPGKGKSSVARFLHLRFIKNNTKSYLLEGFNPSSLGLNYSTHVFQGIKHTGPFILLLDEIDISMAHSKLDNSAVPAVYHSKSKTDFCGFLDGFRDVPSLIVICTSNRSLADLNAEFPEYLRKGRIDQHWEFL
jgi:hypothetical protein